MSAIQDDAKVVDIATHNADPYLDGELPISTSLDALSAKLVMRINNKYAKLKEFVDITRGVHSYRTGGYGQTAFGSGPQTMRDREERPYHSAVPKEGFRPFIRGRDLQRFGSIEASEYVSYGTWLAEPRNPKFFDGERIYSRKILGERLIVTVETTNSVADQQVYITLLKPSQTRAHYLTGILASRLMAFYIRMFYDEEGDAFPQIKVTQLKQLPIRTINFDIPNEKAQHDKMVELVQTMLE